MYPNVTKSSLNPTARSARCRMINWSFHKLSLLAEQLSLVHSSGILGVYKSCILIGLSLSLVIILLVIIISSPVIFIIFIPLSIGNYFWRFLRRIFKVFKKELKVVTRSKLLNLGDTSELDNCQQLLDNLQVDGQLKLGLYKDSPCVFKILYLETVDCELVGFVEFFSRIGQEE